MATAWLVAAALPGLLLLLLAVPVDVAFRARGLEHWRAEVSVRWLFGAVRVARALPGDRHAGRHAPPRAASAPPHRAPRRAGGGDGSRRLIALLRQSAFRQRAWRLLRDLSAAAHPQGLRLWLRLGLGDPADTGRLWALLGPASAIAGQWRAAEVRLEPEFVDAVIEFDAAGRLRVVPLQWLALVLAFALSPAALRAWRTLGAGHGRADGR